MTNTRLETSDHEGKSREGVKTRFKTRRGCTVFRQPYTHQGRRCYATNWSFKVKRGGRQYYFPLSRDRAEAGKMADQIDAFLTVKTNTIEDAQRRFCPEKASPHGQPGEKHVPTVGEFCERYRHAAVHLSRNTITNNVTALRRIAAHILGLPANGKSMPRGLLGKWRAKVDGLPLSSLTPEHVNTFRNALIRAAGQDETARAAAITTGNSYLRCAGSMFAEKWMLSYGDFVLPDPNPFEKVKLLAEGPHRYVSTVDPLALLERARAELMKEHPEAYVVIVLALYCGMRRSEIDKLRWDQVDFENGHIWIRTTADKRPKAANSDARIDAIPEVFDILKEFKSQCDASPYVLPGSADGSVRYRSDGVFRILTPWLRAQGLPQKGTLHALRKEAGSLMYKKTGSVDVAADFLRNDPRVAREHYIGRKGRLELTLGDGGHGSAGFGDAGVTAEEKAGKTRRRTNKGG